MSRHMFPKVIECFEKIIHSLVYRTFENKSVRKNFQIQNK